jgi:EAL domain-containing protein (putative c-di-GMP-specific phosphodiesterase class I)/DNA-binding CsgD family transcriptional regulator
MNATAVTEAGPFEEFVRTNPPQVIVLDLQLGTTDGITQLRTLASLAYTGALVLMSGFDPRVLATARTLAEKLGLNVDTVLKKPVELADLEQTFARLQSTGLSPSPEQIRHAIANEEMVLEFQPIVTRNPKTLLKLEALVRWDHPATGRISPGIFVPVAEGDPETMALLTEWVVAAGVEAYKVLLELGVRTPVSVNMSAQNLRDVTWPDRIERHLEAGAMPASDFCIEITESSAFDDPTLTMEVLSRLRLKGVSLAIDDFGTGFSSLKLLRQMPFSEIKIDQTFVADLATSRDSWAIVKSIVELAGNMGMACVAEGVETEAAAGLLEELGVRSLQGYLIARPMPVESIPAWLAIWTGSDASKPRDPAADRAVADQGSREQGPDSTTPVSPSASSPTDAAAPAVQLTPRQLEVLRLSAEGCSIKQIARRLDIGIGTVKVHLSLAYSALGVHNRIDAIRRAGPAVFERMAERR